MPVSTLRSRVLSLLLVCGLLFLAGCGADNRPQELRDAVALGDDDTVYAVLEHSPEMVTSADLCGNTPLHFAAARGSATLVEVFLNAGANARATDWMGFTPLHWAARAGNLASVQKLLAAQADPASPAQDGWMPIHFAMLARGSLAPADERLALVQLLIAAKVPLSVPAGRWKVTPLHIAVVKGNLALLDALLVAGADPTVKDLDGQTPLDEARATHQADLIARLEAPRGNP